MESFKLYGTANLLNEVDKRIMVHLKDGKTLIGHLRSVDEYANLVLHRTIERIYVGKEYGNVPHGVVIIRGENVALLGEIDEEKEATLPLKKVSMNDILDAQRREEEAKEEHRRLLTIELKGRGCSE